MNFEFNGPFFLFFLLKNFISKHTHFNWLLANRFLPTLHVMLSFAVTRALQFHYNSDFDVGTSHDRQRSWLACEAPSALTAQSTEQPQKPMILQSLEEGKNKCPECTIYPNLSLRSSSSLSVCWQCMTAIWQKPIPWSHNSWIKHFNFIVGGQYWIIYSNWIYLSLWISQTVTHGLNTTIT